MDDGTKKRSHIGVFKQQQEPDYKLLQWEENNRDLHSKQSVLQVGRETHLNFMSELQEQQNASRAGFSTSFEQNQTVHERVSVFKNGGSAAATAIHLSDDSFTEYTMSQYQFKTRVQGAGVSDAETTAADHIFLDTTAINRLTSLEQLDAPDDATDGGTTELETTGQSVIPSGQQDCEGAIILLDGIPDDDNLLSSQRWNSLFIELQFFRAENGHLLIPISDYDLYNWLKTQRTLFHENELSRPRALALTRLDPYWYTASQLAATGLPDDGEEDPLPLANLLYDVPNITDNDRRWRRKFKQLQRFEAKHGHVSVCGKDKPLWRWLTRQRECIHGKHNKRAALTAKRLEALNRLHPSWVDAGFARRPSSLKRAGGPLIGGAVSAELYRRMHQLPVSSNKKPLMSQRT